MIKVKQYVAQKSALSPVDEDSCMCEALCADGASEADSSDCECQDCLDAMAEALNEYANNKARDPRYSPESSVSPPSNNRPKSRQNKPTHKSAHAKKQKLKETKLTSFSQSNITRKPIAKPTCTQQEKEKETCIYHHKPNTKSKEDPKSLQETEDPYELPQAVEVTPASYSVSTAELMFYVNQRIEENLKKRKRFENSEKEEAQRAKERIKQNLERLKWRSGNILANTKKASETDPAFPKKAWNYQGTQEEKAEEKKPQEEHCHKIPIKQKTDTGKVDPEKIQQATFLKEINQRIKRELKARRPADHVKVHAECEYDQCKNTHSRTPAEKLAKLEKKINANAKKYLQKLMQEKKEKYDQEKIMRAKLKGLALEAKKKLEKSKKVSVTDRSTFRLDIDQFSSFSAMRRGDKINLQEVPTLPEAAQAEQEKANRTKQQLQKQQKLVSRMKELKKNKSQQPKSENPKLEQTGKFYVWDIPVSKKDQKSLFEQQIKGDKPRSKPKQPNFREEAERKIMENMEKKNKEKYKKHKEATHKQKVQAKKREILDEYSRKLSQQKPGQDVVSEVFYQKAEDLNKAAKKAAAKKPMSAAPKTKKDSKSMSSLAHVEKYVRNLNNGAQDQEFYIQQQQ